MANFTYKYNFKSVQEQKIKLKRNMKDIDNLYYDAMELLDGGRSGAKKSEKLLLKALAIDPHSPQTYIGLVQVYGVFKNKKKVAECIKNAYAETVKKFPVWPKEMLWGDMDNRAYMRAMQYRADLYADEEEKEKAIELYKLLLRLNPNDNQGVRYTLSGVYAGISGEKINKMFDEGNAKQNWDKLENLVKTQNAKHKFWQEPKY